VACARGWPAAIWHWQTVTIAELNDDANDPQVYNDPAIIVANELML
jgi:hypothetical protein